MKEDLGSWNLKMLFKKRQACVITVKMYALEVVLKGSLQKLSSSAERLSLCCKKIIPKSLRILSLGLNFRNYSHEYFPSILRLEI